MEPISKEAPQFLRPAVRVAPPKRRRVCVSHEKWPYYRGNIEHTQRHAPRFLGRALTVAPPGRGRDGLSHDKAYNTSSFFEDFLHESTLFFETDADGSTSKEKEKSGFTWKTQVHMSNSEKQEASLPSLY